jgi:hypothetical protein
MPPTVKASLTDQPYELRPGATAFLVPWERQPGNLIQVTIIQGAPHWFDKVAFAEHSPVKPGDLLATTQGPRRVVEVRAVEVASISCESWKFGYTLAYDLHDEWHREHPRCDWAWCVGVAKEVKSDD